MKRILSWVFLLSFIGLLLFVVAKPVKAQDKQFRLGVVVDTTAVFCFLKEDAVIIADNKGNVPDELLLSRKCFQGQGRGVYIKETYRNKEWGVYEFSVGNKSFYEATNWKIAPPRGQVGA